jgi:hypothetical protein
MVYHYSIQATFNNLHPGLNWYIGAFSKSKSKQIIAQLLIWRLLKQLESKIEIAQIQECHVYKIWIGLNWFIGVFSKSKSKQMIAQQQIWRLLK